MKSRFATLCLTLGILLSLSATELPLGSAQSPPPPITLTLIEPGGAPFSFVPVAVYLEPYTTAVSYQPQLLSQGSTNEKGGYSFSLVNNTAAQAEGALAESRRVNVLVISVNQAQTWRVDSDTSLPTAAGETFAQTLVASIQETPGESSGQIAAKRETLDVPPCSGAGCPVAPGSAEAAEWEASSGTAAAAEDEALEAGSGDGRSEKWVKTTVQSLSTGMTGSYFYENGRGTRTQIAYRYCIPGGGCDAFRIGAMIGEIRQRNDSFSKSHIGAFNRVWRMEYEYRRYRRCASETRFGCRKWKRSWKPYGWTWDTDSNLNYVRPPRKAENSIDLDQGESYGRQSGDGETFGAGVSVFGLELNSEADYSRITKLTWRTNDFCSSGNKYLYGEFRKPGFAKTVNAETKNC